jgi:hypothetical protein
MASKLLSLPLSGRLNIIEWLETFRNSQCGLREEILDYFGRGNNYTSNLKIDEFNKKVEIIVSALKANGIEIKKTPKGRYSITAAMLKKLTIDKFTPELRKFFFDADLSSIKYDDPNVVPILDKLYKENKLTNFSDIKYFQLFYKFHNLPAMEWLVKTYGVKNYPIIDNNWVASILLNCRSLDREDETIDFYIKMGIIRDGKVLTGLSVYTYPFLRNLSSRSLEKILPFVRISSTAIGQVVIKNMSDLYVENPKYLDFFKFSDDEWKQLAISLLKDDKILFDEDLIADLNSRSKVFVKTISAERDWKHWGEFIKLTPIAKLVLF